MHVVAQNCLIMNSSLKPYSAKLSCGMCFSWSSRCLWGPPRVPYTHQTITLKERRVPPCALPGSSVPASLNLDKPVLWLTADCSSSYWLLFELFPVFLVKLCSVLATTQQVAYVANTLTCWKLAKSHATVLYQYSLITIVFGRCWRDGADITSEFS